MRRLRVLGHPIHPPLVHLPFGLLLAVPVLLGVGQLWLPGWSDAARIVLGLGLIASVPALLTGLLDLAALRRQGPALSVAFVHLTAMVTAVALFVLAWVAWHRPPVALGLAVAGALTLVVGGAAGGHLVYVHRVAVAEEDER